MPNKSWEQQFEERRASYGTAERFIAREEFEARIKESEARAREEARTSFGYWNSLGSGKPKIEILPSLPVGYVNNALKLADLEKAYEGAWFGVDSAAGESKSVVELVERKLMEAAQRMNEETARGLFGLTSQRAVAEIPPAKPALKLPCMETGVRKITFEED